MMHLGAPSQHVLDWAQLLSTLISGFGVAAAWIAIVRWSTDQRWKRKEALFEYSNSFLDTPGARNAMMMLDTESRSIPLWDKQVPEDRYVLVTWQNIERAFRPDEQYRLPSSDMDTAIRDSFGDFFARLARLQYLMEDRLLRNEQARFLVGHWVKVFVRDMEKPHMRNIRIFLDDHENRRVQKLFAAFNVDIFRRVTADRIALAKELANFGESDIS